MSERQLDLSAPEREQIAACLRLLGSLLHKAPDDPTLAPFFTLLGGESLKVEWPFGSESQLDAVQALMTEDTTPARLVEAWQELFIGPHHFEAPPWGSVYLDKENVIFGDSTLVLRHFLALQGVSLEGSLNEPEDHIGLLLWVAAGFIADGRDDALKELMSGHILSWSGRYLELLTKHSCHPFYRGLASLTGLTLDGITEVYSILTLQQELYL